MPAFTFRLATLLRLREAERDQRRVALAEVQRADEELQRRLAAVCEEKRQGQQQCREAAGPGAIAVATLMELQTYISTLQSEQAAIERERLALAGKIERRRQAVIEADREVQMLEKLREKQLAAHDEEENRREGRRLDEAALQGAIAR